MNDLDLIRDYVNLLRSDIGHALAEKNIPHSPTWTQLAPGSLDAIDEAVKRLREEIGEVLEYGGCQHYEPGEIGACFNHADNDPCPACVFERKLRE